MNDQPIKPIGSDLGKMTEASTSASGANETNLHARKRRIGIRQQATPTNIRLLQMFWWGVLGLLGYCTFTWPGRSWVLTSSGLLVALFALLPAYLWCRRSIVGLPIFPCFAGTYVFTHALQFLAATPRLREYSDDAIWRAALTTSTFLFAGTLVWWFWVKLPRSLPPMCRVLELRRGTDFLFLILTASTLVTIIDHAGLLAPVPAGIRTAIEHFFGGPTAFAVFVLAVRWGSRSLRQDQISLFIGLFITYCIADASSLFLVSVVIMCLMLVLGFIIGRRTVPWHWLVPMVAIIAFLHAGKGEMRSVYWAEGTQGDIIAPWKYPSFYTEWLQDSARQLINQKQGGEEGQTVLSRINTLFILLEAQEKAPSDVPFLKGETYVIIPSALVPRIFNSNKTSPHDSTSILNVHFENQTWEESQSTSIGWGLLNEAYANFGNAGCLILAVVLGTFYGLITRASIGLPPTSLPVMVSVFTFSFTVQTEMTAAIYITAYLQGLFALLVMAYPFTELRPLGANLRNKNEESGGRWSEARTRWVKH